MRRKTPQLYLNKYFSGVGNFMLLKGQLGGYPLQYSSRLGSIGIGNNNWNWGWETVQIKL